MIKPDITITPVTSADILEFYGAPSERTLRALAIRRDGVLVAIAGVAVECGRNVAFSDVKEGVTAPKKTIWRVAKEIMKYISAIKSPTIAITKSSEKFIQRLGFIEYIGRCENGRIYKLWLN